MRIRSLATALCAMLLAATCAAGATNASAADASQPASTAPTLHAQVGTIITQSGTAKINPALNPLTNPAATPFTAPHHAAGVAAWCNVTLQPPFQVTSGGAIYGQSRYNSCSTPAPQACRLIVDLERGNPLYGGSTIGHGDSGWRSCSGYVNASTGCIFSVVKQPYYTTVSLEVEYLGLYGTNVGQSSMAYLPCH